MIINTENIFSMTQANQNFSALARTADREGEVIIFKNNKPKYIVINMDNSDRLIDLTEDEKIDIVSKRVLKKYIEAFRELAK